MSIGSGFERLIIEGIREDNKKFRPSDWAERISATLASFGSDHRLRYSEYVHPCIINDEQCLIVNLKIKETCPEALDFILHFARQNKLRIQEDRRIAQQNVEVERRTLQQDGAPLADNTMIPEPAPV